ncbi:MAG: hypothetical protein J5737_06495 [Bacteroidales bacterium]|nr:hypothetical protein [Bacteroidales bacterium]
MKKKTAYLAPVTEVLVLHYGGIVCGSETGNRAASFDNEYDDQSWD